MAEETTAVAPVAPSYESRMARFSETWEKALPIVRQLLPAHVTAERIFSVAVTARQRNPKLLQCTDISVLRGIIIGAQLGLDVSGVGGKAWLVPYKNTRTGEMEAQFQAGYRGLIELAQRTGKVVAIYARAVYEGDDFMYEDGMVQTLRHVPKMEGDAGKVVGAWAVAVFANGFRQAEVMNRIQIDRIRQTSRAADSGPWDKWYAEMAIKSVIKRLLKKLPDSPELQTVEDVETAAELGTFPTMIDGRLEALDITTVPGRDAIAPSRTEAIREEVKKRGPGRPPKPKVDEVPPQPEAGHLGSLPEPPPADYDDSYDAD